jgi:DNA-binding CsgD family transcriptional regulator
MANVSLDELMIATARLGEAVVDPAAWPSVMEDICHAVGTTGAIMLQSDVRTPDIPHTTSLSELTDIYFREGWHLNDIRGKRGIPRFLMGEQVFTDWDLFKEAELRQEPYYNEFMIPNGFKWFAAIAFRADTALWALALQRTPKEGAFQSDTKRILGQISQRLSEAATLSKLVSRTILTGSTNALALVQQPALAIDRFGVVLAANAIAELMFNDEVRVCNRRLYIADRCARTEFDRFVDKVRIARDADPLPADPIVIRRQGNPSILIRILPVEPAARSPFLGARALLVLVDLGLRHLPDFQLFARPFGLTPAEAKLARLLSTGESLANAADQLRITVETARNQLKAIFGKTGTHKQGALVALLARLSNH